MTRWLLPTVAMVLYGSTAFASPARPNPMKFTLTIPDYDPVAARAVGANLFVAAQGDEPTPAPTPGDEPAPAPAAKGDEPGSSPASGDEPGPPTTGGDEPDAAGGASEPKKDADAGAPAAPTDAAITKEVAKVQYGVGVHVRAIFVHSWLLGLFTDANTSLNSVAFGGEFVRRKADFDIVASVDFAFYSPPDGNWMGKNKEPTTDPDLLTFNGLNSLMFAVHFIWHYRLNQLVSVVYGAGVGLGIVLGDIERISNFGCTADNIEDISACAPLGVRDGSRQEDLRLLREGKATTDGRGKCDPSREQGPTNPCPFQEEDVWPVVPVVHVLVGFNFDISKNFSVRVDGGFRDAFYIGATTHYFF